MEYVISKLDMNDMMSAILKNQKEKEISSQLDTILRVLLIGLQKLEIAFFMMEMGLWKKKK